MGVQLALLQEPIQLHWHLSLSSATLQAHVKYRVGLCISHASQAPDGPLATAEVLANGVSCVLEKEMFETILRLNSDFAYVAARRGRVLHRRELARAYLLPSETVLLVKATCYGNAAGRTGACTGGSFSYRKHVETIVISEPYHGQFGSQGLQSGNYQ